MALRDALRSWHGEQIAADVERAVVAGINETLALCVGFSIPRAPIDTGFLRASAFVRPARRTASGVVGQWGYSASYAAYVELGTVRMPARPYMRPAADALYSGLAARIRRHYR
jgi:hypothetical protein